jgi:hypothetical protein
MKRLPENDPADDQHFTHPLVAMQTKPAERRLSEIVEGP